MCLWAWWKWRSVLSKARSWKGMRLLYSWLHHPRHVSIQAFWDRHAVRKPTDHLERSWDYMERCLANPTLLQPPCSHHPISTSSTAKWTAAWVNPNQNCPDKPFLNSQPTDTIKNDCCVRPPSIGMICCAVITRILGKLLNLSVPQFPHLYNGDNNSYIRHTGLFGALNKWG